MKFLVREEVLAWGDDFQILDENANPVYVVDGAGVSLFNKLAIMTPDKKVVGTIEQTLFSFGREYVIQLGTTPVAKVMSQRASYGTVQFSIDCMGKENLGATGDFYNHEYTIMRGEKVLARVSNHQQDVGFDVDVLSSDEQVLLLASIIVIEVINRDGGQAGPMYS